MQEEKSVVKLPHVLTLDNRKSLILSGISDVDSFDEQSVTAYTDIGELTIRGQNLHISKLNLDTGDLELDGLIISMTYTNNQSSSGGGLFSKLFK